MKHDSKDGTTKGETHRKSKKERKRKKKGRKEKGKKILQTYRTVVRECKLTYCNLYLPEDFAVFQTALVCLLKVLGWGLVL